jgi:hypothetical protein
MTPVAGCSLRGTPPCDGEPGSATSNGESDVAPTTKAAAAVHVASVIGFLRLLENSRVVNAWSANSARLSFIAGDCAPLGAKRVRTRRLDEGVRNNRAKKVDVIVSMLVLRRVTVHTKVRGIPVSALSGRHGPEV